MKKIHREPMKEGWQMLVAFGVFLLVLFILVEISWGGNWTRYQVVYNGSADSARVVLKTGTTISDTDTLTSLPDSVLHTLDSTIGYNVEVYCWYPGYADEFSYFDYHIAPLEVAVNLGSDSVYVKGGIVDTLRHNESEGTNPLADKIISFVVIDSSGTDSKVTGVTISATDIDGNNGQQATSHSGGTCSLTVVDGLYSIRASKNGYIFSSDSFTVSADYTDTVWGYNIDLGTSGDPDLCRVYGTVRTLGGAVVPYAKFTITMPTNAYDSCSDATLDQTAIPVVANGSGVWYVDLVKSHCLVTMGSTTDLEYTATYGQKVTKFTVPDQDQYNVIIGQ